MFYSTTKLFFGFALSMFCLQVAAADTTVVKSPDGNISFQLFQKNQQFFFTVSYGGQPVIVPSPMDISVDDISCNKQFVIQKTERYSSNETYPVFGPHAKAVNSFNGIIVFTTSGGGALPVTFDIRVFNDGPAFGSSVLSEQSTLTPEGTQFLIFLQKLLFGIMIFTCIMKEYM